MLEDSRTHQEEPIPDEEDAGTSSKSPGQKKFTPVSFHGKCAKRVEKHLDLSLVKETRTIYRSPDGNLRILFAVSKAHKAGNNITFWFAFHPHQRELLKEAKEAYVAFGCASEDAVVLIPLSEFEPHLDDTWTTEADDRMYWHVHIGKNGDKFTWLLRKGKTNLPLNQYLVPSSAD